MRLLYKTSKLYLLFSIILFLIASIILYFILTAIINKEINEKLCINAERISEQIAQDQTIPYLYPIIEVKEFSNPIENVLTIKDTLIYDPIEKEVESFREISSIKNINGKKYKITVRYSLIEADNILYAIGLSIGIVFIILLLGLFRLNMRISQKIWQPFYHNLEILKNFSLREENPISLKSSDITEFEELNSSVKKLTEKIRSDYHSLKEFTENASHEIQTPLAIIQSKLELLMQIPELSEEQARHIQSVYTTSQRLSKLNQTLLLLAKIENRQFPERKLVNLAELIEKQLGHYSDFIKEKGIIVEKHLGDIIVTTNPVLAETLISNLLNNAIRHNIEQGQIKIELRDETFTIANTGKPLSVPPEKLFERFHKANQSSESLGLGLSLVKQICITNKWEIRYRSEDERHIIQIQF